MSNEIEISDPAILAKKRTADRAAKRELAILCQEKFTENFDKVMSRILDIESPSRADRTLQLETLKWLSNRGWGMPPKKIEDDSGTFEALVRGLEAKAMERLRELEANAAALPTTIVEEAKAVQDALEIIDQVTE